MVDGKGGHQPLKQGRDISVILAEEKVGRKLWKWQPSKLLVTSLLLKVGISQ